MLKKIISYFLAFTWELPQTIIALFCLLFIKCEKMKAQLGSGNWYAHNNNFLTCWSLGEFLFFRGKYQSENTKKHEYGHSIQSRILGPLYLILIALPSVIWNLLSRFIPWCSEHYYDTPWEHWADKLGGVNR